MAVSPRVEVDPALLEWACNRSGVEQKELELKFRALPEWLNGEKLPTEKQLQSFANATFTPFGSFFSAKPPVDTLPVADFRVRRKRPNSPPSPHLLDTLFLCQDQQAWYRDYLLDAGESSLDWVGSQRLDISPKIAATQCANELNLTVDSRSHASNWEEGLRVVRQALEAAGVHVMINGVVGNNNKRPLDPDEFSGFALADTLAPLIFINNTDYKASQMFTIAHEVGHLLLGESGISDDSVGLEQVPANESWCDSFAAELLVPEADLHSLGIELTDVGLSDVQRLASRYKVSRVVVLRRLRTSGFLGRQRYSNLFAQERNEYIARKSEREAAGSQSGGNFYNNFFQRTGRHFASAVVASTLEGQTNYTEMSKLLGISSISTFETIVDRVGLRVS